MRGPCVTLAAALLAAAPAAGSGTAFAANTPCSGSKGGVSHCKDHLFMCNDGSVSQSKKICPAELHGTAPRNGEPEKRPAQRR